MAALHYVINGAFGVRIPAQTGHLFRMNPASGILVTRFWYIRAVDRRTILYTGLTRDGTFLIENDKVTRPIKNFRFNESPIFFLNHLQAMGSTIRIN